jgi:hypothetical protein
MEQLYLEQMVFKPMPKKPTDVNIKIKMAKTEITGESEPITIVKPTIKIVDKREHLNVNREMILERLQKQNVFRVRRLEPPQKSAKTEDVDELAVISIKRPTKISQSITIRKSAEQKSKERDEPEVATKVDEQLEAEESEIEKEEKEVKSEKKQDAEKEVKSEDEEKQEPEDEDKEKSDEKPKAKRGRKTKQPKETDLITKEQIKINEKILKNRLPKTDKIIVRTSPYYMANRRIFIQKLREMFQPYVKELDNPDENINCEANAKNEDFKLLTHQKIVRDYLTLYTPYRGLLLYFGLGSGKTCSSIAIAEGMKSEKNIVVMTPASLKMNFFSELKKCGDSLYRTNQYWEFVSIDGKSEYVALLEKVLSIPGKTIENNRGAWLMDVNKAPNFALLNTVDQESIDEQLNAMIRSKYTDLNYNGLTKNRINTLTENGTKNPFDNKVIIIDEAHNFVSRIVNKIKKPNSISYKLYDYLMKAQNARIVLLTGTPIINYPNEIGILYNILRGSIKTWTIPVVVKTKEKVNRDEILSMFAKEHFQHYDYVEYSDNKLMITRNPYGFLNTSKKTKKATGGKSKKNNCKEKKNHTKKVKHDDRDESEKPYKINPEGILKIKYYPEQEIESDAKVEDRVAPEYHKGGESDEFAKYTGVKLDENSGLSDEDFLKKIKYILQKNKLDIVDGLIEINHYKALPDEADSFLNMFVDLESGNMKNENAFKKRILGLTSYFRSAQEQLLPKLIKSEDDRPYHVMPIEMSEHQFSSYIKIRKGEIDQEKKQKIAKQKQAKKGDNDDLFTVSSTYRIFSRAACNFTFPPNIERPLPDKMDTEVSEEQLDVVPKQLMLETNAFVDQEDVEEAEEETVTYKQRIDSALQMLAYDSSLGDDEEQYLSTAGLSKYSPKFLKVFENIKDTENQGLHLLYSQFRTIEGIEILKLILEANGFAEFKIKKNVSSNTWEIIEKEGDEGKPHFVLYTGTEMADEKEIIRNIYNSTWKNLPSEIYEKLKGKSSNNFYGEIIKLFMITSSGAEGINLKNTRFVHIVEPYWHNVRLEQVIGRARRICSHQDLPDELRTVKVFLYLSVFSETQKTDKKNIEVMNHDVSRVDGRSITTDESLHEIAFLKENINQKILKSMKEAAIDCSVYNKSSKKGIDDEQLICYGSNFAKITSNDYISYPMLDKDLGEKDELNVKEMKIKLKDTKEINGIKYKIDPKTNELYDATIFENSRQLVKVGELKKVGNRYAVELLQK